jgi:hypothetical protein
VVPRAQRDDVGMFEKKQLIGNQALFALFDKVFLEVQAGLIVDETEMPYIHASSNFSSRSLM